MRQFTKLMGRWLAVGAAFSMVFAMTTTAYAQPKQGKAVVRNVSGSAQRAVEGQWKALSQGQTLKSGATVRTLANGQATLFLGINGPLVTLDNSTVLTLEKLTFEKVGGEAIIETQLDLKQGAIHGRVRKTSDESTYEIHTRNSVVGVKGPSQYYVTADDKATAKAGQVIVVYSDPETGESSTFVVNGGFTFDPNIQDTRQATPTEIAERVPPEPAEVAEAPAPTETEIFVSPVTPQGAGASTTHGSGGGDTGGSGNGGTGGTGGNGGNGGNGAIFPTPDDQ